MRTPIGELWLDDDGILWHRIDVLVVSTDAAQEVRDAVAELTGGRPVPAVVDIRSVGYAGHEARSLFESAEGDPWELATALVVESSSSQAMANLFVGMTEPGRPVRVFTSEDEAAGWARTFLTETDSI